MGGFVPAPPLPERRFVLTAKGDGQTVSDFAATAASAVVTSASVAFGPSDIGKLITIAGAGASGGPLNSTIQSVSGGAATLAVAAGTTVSGATGTYGTDMAPALASLVNRAWLSGGGVLYIPTGLYCMGSGLTWRSRLSLVGDGIGKTILKWMSPNDMTASVFQGLSANVNNPYVDCQFRHFEVDCDAATLTTYRVEAKAFYLQYMRRPVFQNLYVHGTPATGIGVDFLVDAVITDNIVENCGRLNGGTNLGGAGIGIGIGAFTRESMVVSGNFLLNNGTFGAFFEEQSNNTIASQTSAKVFGNYITLNSNNACAIGDCGLQRFECFGNRVIGSTGCKDGIVVRQGTIPTISGGVDGKIFDNTISGVQSAIGIYYNNVAPNSTICRYDITDNKISNVTNFGINVQTNSTYVLDTLVIKGNTISKASNSAIVLLGAGGMKDVDISNNTIQNCSQAATANQYKCGVSVSSPVARLRMIGNTIYDNQTTPTQLYAIIINGVAVTGAYLADNDLRFNVTGAISLMNSGTITGVIANNPGYNPLGPVTVTPSASPWTYTAGNTPERLYINGGTVSAVTKNSITLAAASPTAVDLQPGESAIVTYSAAPTAVADRR